MQRSDLAFSTVEPLEEAWGYQRNNKAVIIYKKEAKT